MYQCFGDGPFVYRLNENGSGPNLLSQVCIERGWREYSPEQGDSWNLWWKTTGFSLSQYKEITYSQFTNHIPKGSAICRKDNLARHLKRMRKVYGSIYDFSPHCYNLPLEYTKLAAECSRSLRCGDGKSADVKRSPDARYPAEIKERVSWRTLALERVHVTRWSTPDYSAIRRAERGFEDSPVWICKPVAQSQGKGIFLFRKLSELTYESSAVVQRYIERPLLIGGYKFDLRLYVCVPSYHPLTIYVYREGLARFGTDKFSLSDLSNPYRHLTNSSINKMGPGYSEIKERVGAGCKWTLRQLRRYFQHVAILDWLLWQRISCLIVLTILSHAPVIPQTVNCFEFFGFDVLLDSELRPWLLEVNLSPALGNDCQADEDVKRPLLHDLFDLLGLPLYNTGLALYTMHSKHDSPSNEEREDEKIHASKTTKTVMNAAGRWRKHRKGSARSGRSKTKSSTVNKAGALSNICKSQILLPTKPRIWDSITTTPCGSLNSNPIYARKGIWGNGKNWKDAPASEGGWTRIFPNFEGEHVIHNDGSVKLMVHQIQKFKKTAFDIVKNYPGESDYEWSERLQNALNLTANIWIPYD